MRAALRLAALAAGLAAPLAHAVEGGTGAYLLGSRDSLAGITPPPGNYISNDMVFPTSEAPVLSLGGFAFTDFSGSFFINKLKYLHEFAGRRRFESDVVWGTLNLAF